MRRFASACLFASFSAAASCRLLAEGELDDGAAGGSVATSTAASAASGSSGGGASSSSSGSSGGGGASGSAGGGGTGAATGGGGAGGGLVCAPGTKDCNQSPDDGCETTLGTESDCSDCDDACTVAGGSGACVGGTCKVGSCTPPFADCNDSYSDGCEVDTSSTPAHCGGCQQPCDATNGAPSCVGSTCAIACFMGFDDCDNDVATGCETDLGTDPAHCGSCTKPCSLPNASAACVGGACAIAGCDAGWGDCDATLSNGCETDTETSLAHCGACGAPCNAVGAVAASCNGGSCAFTCSAGLGDCDANGANGCEADVLASNVNCGTCGNDCLAGRTCGAGACSPPWVTMTTTNAPAMRQQAAAGWMGSELFVWGGHGVAADLDTGGMYDPKTDTWTALPTAGAPSPRVLATAVWTGARMVVWGGGAFANLVGIADGKRYEPSSGQWLPINALGAPGPRRGAIGVSTGAKVLLWGGVHNGSAVAGGALYDDASDSWSPVASAGAPTARTGVAYAWTGTELLLFGGQIGGVGATNQGYGYNPTTDQWHVLAPGDPKTPSARRDAFGVWANGKFLVWGGRDAAGSSVSDGAAYDPAMDTWSVPFATGGAPSKRAAPARQTGWTGWTGTRMLVRGGFDNGSKKTDGRDYQPSSDAWFAPPSWPSGNDHEWGVGLWTGQELILWSGLDGGALDAAGERWK